MVVCVQSNSSRSVSPFFVQHVTFIVAVIYIFFYFILHSFTVGKVALKMEEEKYTIVYNIKKKNKKNLNRIKKGVERKISPKGQQLWHIFLLMRFEILNDLLNNELSPV